MRFEIVTLFPELFDALGVGLLGKAQARGEIAVQLSNPRDFTEDRHRTVDDAPYGGGSGMVLMAAPYLDALDALDNERAGVPTRRVLLTPQGAPFTQAHAERLAAEPCVTLICGRYEGFDERIREAVDEELSLGDFVLLGGEVAALAVVEAVARLLPGVVGNRGSLVEESHTTGLLEYPQYTRPPELRGRTVPTVLLSGNHEAIRRWRRQQALLRTRARRPDLFAAIELSAEDRALLAEADATEAAGERPSGSGPRDA